MPLTKTKETNDLSYPEIKADNLSPLEDFLLVQWQLAQEHIKLGKVTLIRPDTHRNQVYVGIVLACGPSVDPMVKPGDRIIFDQFSNFHKYWDELYGRVALLQESKQAALFAVVPQRMEVEASEPDFNWDV